MPALAQALTVADVLREHNVAPATRLRVLRLLAEFAGVVAPKATEIERAVFAMERSSPDAYLALARRVAFNMACNRTLASVDTRRLLHLTDDEMSAGTIIRHVQSEEAARMARYTELLKEKYDNVMRAQQAGESMLKCRNCGSSNISWNQVQIRGADESSTIFCSCLNPKCKKRWRLG